MVENKALSWFPNALSPYRIKYSARKCGLLARTVPIGLPFIGVKFSQRFSTLSYTHIPDFGPGFLFLQEALKQAAQITV